MGARSALAFWSGPFIAAYRNAQARCISRGAGTTSVAAAAGCDKDRRAFGAWEIAATVPVVRSLRQRLQGWFTKCRSNAVATPPTPTYGSTVAAKSANRLGGLIESRRNSAPTNHAGAFFAPAYLRYGGLRGRTFGFAGSLIPGPPILRNPPP